MVIIVVGEYIVAFLPTEKVFFEKKAYFHSLHSNKSVFVLILFIYYTHL